MKKFYFLLITVLTTISVWSQTKTWNGGNGSWADATKWSPAVIPVAGDIIVFSDGNAAIITNVPSITLKRITVTGNTTITLQAAAPKILTLDNVNAATELGINAGSSLTMGSDVDITLDNNSTATIAGVLTISTSRIYTTDKGSSETTVTGTIDNKGLIVAKSNGNSLSFASGGSYIHSQNGGIVPAANWNNNSNCIITGVVNTMPTTAGFRQDFGNFTWNSPGQNTPLSFDRDLENIDGNFTIISTGTGNIRLTNTGNFNTRVRGNYIQTGGTLVLNQTSGNGIMTIDGNFNMSGGVLAKNSSPSSSSTLIFSNAGAGFHTFTKTIGTITGSINFIVPGESTIDFGISVLDGPAASFTLNNGAKIITSHPAGLNSAGATGSIQTLTRSFSIEADYEFHGNVTGIFNTGGSSNTTASVVNNLTINNVSGSVTLSKPVTIANGPNSNMLYLQSGALITTATNILTLNDGVQATGVPGLQPNNYNLNSFVDGPLKKIGNDLFIFPVGKIGSGLRKIGITVPLGGSNTITSFTAEFKRSNPQTLSNTLGAGLARLSACEYWTLDRFSTNQVRVILSWEANSGCPGQYVTDLATLRVAHLVGNTWMDEGNLAASVTGSTTAGTVTSNNFVTTFSPFALASSSLITNPLPVIFADVKAYEKNSGVQIEWSNLTEKDVAEYTIERSANGRDFSAIGQQLPASNQNDKASYNAFDATPNAGINYYRIKAEETTGKIVYSKILSVNTDVQARGLSLYPNPVSGNQVTISLSGVKRGQYSLRVINNAGQDIFKQMITNHSSSLTQIIALPSSVKPGIYNMVVAGDDYRESKMFIVQ